MHSCWLKVLIFKKISMKMCLIVKEKKTIFLFWMWNMRQTWSAHKQSEMCMLLLALSFHIFRKYFQLGSHPISSHRSEECVLSTVLSLRLSDVLSLKETPRRRWEPIWTGIVGNSHWMGWDVVWKRPACWTSASLQQPCKKKHNKITWLIQIHENTQMQSHVYK